MEPFRHHVFVCTQDKPEGVTSCPGNRSLRVLQALERELITQGLDDEVQVTTCGCLGMCDDGPIMIVYPEGIWYHKVKKEDVPEIVNSHLRSGEVMSRLAWSDSQAMKAEATEHRDRYRAMLKARDEAGTLPDDLNEMIRGFMPSRAVLTALELDVFTAVGAGATVEEVAEKIHGDSRATEALLNAVVSLKLLEKRDETFFPTPVSARFFSADSRDNARPALMHTAHLWHRWSTLTECLRAGTSVGKRGVDENWVTAFIAAMDRNAKERAAAVVKAVAASGISRMLDLGGGSGAYSIAFARAIPELECEILEQSDVVGLTQEYIRKAGLTDRITTRTGDMLRGPLGKNYDLILVSAICHMFSADENRRLFHQIREALAPHGRVVVSDFILEPSKTAPRAGALFSLNMLVGTQAGSSYSEPEYTQWLQSAGFSDVCRLRLPGPTGLMIGIRI
ncbi:MAG: methyltransferase [Candidatus Sulfotelmatobacter sp.]